MRDWDNVKPDLAIAYLPKVQWSWERADGLEANFRTHLPSWSTQFKSIVTKKTRDADSWLCIFGLKCFLFLLIKKIKPLKIYFIHLMCSGTEQREEMKRGLPSTVHTPNGNKGPSWDKLKPRTRNFLWVSQMGVGVMAPSTWAILCGFPRSFSKELSLKWNSKNLNQCPHGMQALQVVTTCCITALVP